MAGTFTYEDAASSAEPDLDAIEQEHGLPKGILAAIQHAEGSGDTSVSPKGARGRFQFMPATAKKFGLDDPNDPVKSANAAGRYLKYAKDTYKTDDPMVLAAEYNGGPAQARAVLAGNAPPALETQKYIKNVSAKMPKADNTFSYEDATFSYEDAGGKPAAAKPAAAKQADTSLDYSSPFFNPASEALAHVATGAVAAPVGNLAGLGAMAAHYFGLTDKLPTEVRDQVQQAMTYEPRTAGGQQAIKPIQAVGGLIEKGAGAVADLISPDKTGPLNPLNAGTKEAIVQGINLLGMKGGAAAEAGAVAKQGALDIAKGSNALKDATRDAAIAANYIPPPEGGIQAVLGGISKTKTENRLSALNEQNATLRLKTEVGSAPEQALNGAEFSRLKTDAGQAYDAVKEAAGPRLRVTPEFEDSLRKSLGAVNAKLAYDSKTYEGLKPARDLIQSYLRKISPPPAAPPMKDIPGVMKTIAEVAQNQPGPAIARTLESVAAETPYHFGLPPAEAMPVPTPRVGTLGTSQTIQAIQALRNYAKDDFRLGNKDMGTARLGIAHQLESMVETNLAQSGQAGLLDQFKAARERFAKIYLLDRVTNPTTGFVDLQKLRSLANTPAYKGVLTGEFKTAADFANTYGKAAKNVTGGSGAVGLSPFDWMFGVGSLMHGNPKAAAMEIAGRLAVPMLAERGMLKNATPSYQVGAARSAAPTALQAASIAATQQPRNSQEVLAKLLGGR